MKKIGIVTIIDYYNYGNRLQNYAVSYLLNERLKCKAETIERYEGRYIEGSVIAYIKEQAALQLCRFPGIAEKVLNEKTIRWFRFSEWSWKWIPRIRLYHCKMIPEKLNKRYDLFFSGSDQVWNYKIRGLRMEDFLLSFAERDKKIAISASFGVDSIPEEKRLFYRDCLSEFSHISVREETGAKIIKDLTGRDVPVLIDPVLMLKPEEWMRVEKRPRVDISKPYILKFFLGTEVSDIDMWAKSNGYLVYDLGNISNKALYSSGPGEFLSLVRNAALVCSDSFHCIAFSILYTRPFIAYKREGTENYMLSRLNTMLTKFGFEDRWNYLLEPEDYMRCSFERSKERLKKEQARFMDYIMEVLGISSVV